jgi:hypothetical protein
MAVSSPDEWRRVISENIPTFIDFAGGRDFLRCCQCQMGANLDCSKALIES